MKTYLATLAGILFVVTSVLGQPKQIHIPLKSGESITKVIQAKEGLIVKRSTESRDIAVDFFNKNLEKVFSAPLADYKVKSNRMASAPSGAYTYILDVATGLTTFSKTTPSIIQIDQGGKVRRKDFEKGKSLHSKHAIFADEEHFYVLSSENGDHLAKKGKLKEKLVLHRISHQDLSYKMLYVNVPMIQSKKHSYWSLVQVTDQGFYVASKTMTENRQDITVLKIDSEGKVASEKKLTTELSDAYFRPSNNATSTHGIYWTEEYKWDFYITHQTSAARTVSVPVPREGAFGGIYVDRDTEEMYTFGLYGGDYDRSGSRTSGLFVHKFDKQGGLLWKHQQEASELLKDDKWFYKLRRPEDCKLKFTPFEDGSSMLQIVLRDMVYSRAISPSGQLEKEYNHKFKGWIEWGREGLCFSPKHTHPIARHIASKEDFLSKSWKYQAFRLRTGYILLKKEDEEAKLLYFADPVSMK